MADSSHIDSNIITTATDSAGNQVISVVQSNVTESTSVASTVTTGGKGDPGIGIPTGGTTGQVLAKSSDSSYDTLWSTPATGVTSVNAQTGVVSLTQDNVTDGTTYKQYSLTEKTKLSGIATGATANDTDVNLKARANHTGTQSADTLTDGTTNKAFLATERTKLSGIATAATANDTDANLKARANHTGTQTASTISDFSTAADARVVAASRRVVRYTVTRDATQPADYICDGVADDVEIQAALAAANAAGGGTVVLLAGTNAYRIATTIAMPENVTLRGERMARQSSGGVTLKAAASTSLTNLVTVTGTTNPASNADLKHDIVFENITFDGNNTTTNNVKLTNQDTVKFIDCRFIQSTNGLVTAWDSTTAPTAATIPGGIYMVRCNISPASGGIGVDLQYQTQCWFISCWHTPPSGTPAAHFRIKSSNKIDIQGSEFNTATTALLFEDVSTGGAMDYSTYDIMVRAKTFANGGTVIDDNRTHASSGNVTISGTMSNGTTLGDKLVGSGNIVNVNDNFTPLSVLSQAAADKVLTLKGFASQSGRYLEAQNSSATAIAYMNSGGNWYVNNGSISAVSYGFTSEINTGMYRIGAGNLGFALSGALHLDLSTTVVDVKTKKVSNVVDPTSAQDAATKNYADTASTIYHPSGTDVAIADGGTGASSAAAARTNLAVGEASGWAKLTVGTVAPSSPSVGDIWIDTN
jgi:hypothetical protein